MDKSYIIKQLIQASRLYQENLENRNLLFIYTVKEDINYIETKFLKSNFMHLTGIKCKNEKANSFYDKCIKKRIKKEEIQLRKDGNTQRKIEVLLSNVTINKNARMIGNFNQSQINLYSDKIIGTSHSVLGFIKSQKYYIPNTSLKEDIRNLTTQRAKIICILSKQIQEKSYKQITYINKNYDIPIKEMFSKD